MRKMNVLWVTNIPSPYRVDFFNEFGKYCNLVVIFEKKSSTERDKSWEKFQIKNFKAIFLNGIRLGVDATFSPNIIKYLKKNKYDNIVITNYSNLTGIIAILTVKIKKIPYIIEGDGAFAGSGKGFKEKMKCWIISGANLCFSTSKHHDAYYEKYRAKKIVRYPFTSVMEGDLIKNFSGVVRKEDEVSQILNSASLNKYKIWEFRNQLRDFEKKKLGIKENKVVLSVGQFIHRKGFDILIDASKSLGENIGIYIVGGIPTKEYLERAEGFSNIHFMNFLPKQELGSFYRAADCFVLPTREDIWGLVVNEAMSYMLPIITTDRCIAGMELVTNNGYIINNEDVYDLTEKINIVLNNPMNYAINSYINIQNYTIEKMAERHKEILL